MITTHRVPVEQFDGLARGDGGASAIGTLLAGQLSKRVLQVRALLELAAGGAASAAEAAAATHAFEVLAETRRAAPASTDRILLYPPVGAWAAHCVARLRPTAEGPTLSASEAGLGHLGAIAASAAVLAARSLETGEGFSETPNPAEQIRITVPLRDGGVVLPMVGRVILSDDPEHGAALVCIDPAEITVRAGSRTVTLPPDLTVDAPGWRALPRLLAGPDGHQLSIWLDDVDPFREYADLALAPQLADDAISEWSSALIQAWSLLTTHHAEAAAALAAGLVSLIPLVDAADGRGVSATAVNAFGAAAMTRPADGLTLAVGLVHEFQHSKLSALLDLVPLYDRTTEHLLYAPWRDDPRPIGGLLQGAYAYLGVTGFWGRQRYLVADGESAFAHFQFARWREQAARAAAVIAESGCLTEAGGRFVAGMREVLAELALDPVPADALLAARQATTDHWLIWRVRNLRPDPADVVSLAHDRMANTPPPRGPAPRSVPGAGQFAPVPNDRLTLLHQRLRGAALMPDARPADLAYLRGDYQGAEAGYREEIDREPEAAYAWAGLALTLQQAGEPSGRMLCRRPELVVAVHRTIRDRTGVAADPVALADWLAMLGPAPDDQSSWTDER